MLSLKVSELKDRIKLGEDTFENIVCRSSSSIGIDLYGVTFVNCVLGYNLFNDIGLENCTFKDCYELPYFWFSVFEETIDFTGSYLYKCLFQGATFYDTKLILDRAKPPYNFSRFWAELLKHKATTLEQRQVVALIYSAEYLGWCWHDFLEMNHPLQDWVLDTLRSYNLDFSNCPEEAKILLG